MKHSKKLTIKNLETVPRNNHLTTGLTIFACPKPFTNPHTDIIQRNAIISWTLLHPKPEIILFGNERGVAKICKEFRLHYAPEVERTEFGTPLLDDVFEKAQQMASFNILCYVNADIILMSDFARAVEQMRRWQKSFLMVGQRCDIDIREPLDFSQLNWEENLQALVRESGKQKPPGWIDYFVFSKGLFNALLPLAIGRPHFDNWLVWYAGHLKATIVDGSPSILAIHQNHDYSHIKGGNSIWRCSEALRNEQLIKDWIYLRTAAHASYVLTNNGIRKARGRYYINARLELWRRRLISWTRPLRHAIGLRQKKLTP